MGAINRRSLVAEIGLLLLLVGGLEAGLRYYVARPDATLYPNLFPSPLTTGKYLAYRQLGEPPDVLLMGMSQMARLSAAELARILHEREHQPVNAFNIAAPGHSVQFDRRLLDDVLMKIERPRLVVYGVIPTNLIMEPSADFRTARSPVFDVYGSTPAAALYRALFHRFDLLLYRESIRDALLGMQTKNTRRWTAVARNVGPTGDMPPPPAKPRRPHPDRWERANVGTPFLEFDALMQSTALFDRLSELAETCRRLEVPLVLLENPVSPIYLELLPRGADDYRRFRERVRATAAAAGVPLIDPAPDGIGDPELFADATHHTPAGVTWMSGEIARFLVEHGLVGGAAGRRA